MSEYHTPVLLEESIGMMDIRSGGVYADATFGGGGHSAAILSRLGADGVLVAFDKDPEALAGAPQDNRLRCIRNNFRYIHQLLRHAGFPAVDGIIADLGVSSHQFDTAERGFSFRFDAPLDMRMNPSARCNARDLLNTATEAELEEILRLYGEVERSARVAGAICRRRERGRLETTGDLHEALEGLLPAIGAHKYLAKIYQAIRIEVNGEMRDLEGFLKGASRSLKEGGILAVITYHSLEDRLVKNFIKAGNRSGIPQRDEKGRQNLPLEPVNKKPVLPAEGEIAANPRARSAKLRCARKRPAEGNGVQK